MTTKTVPSAQSTSDAARRQELVQTAAGIFLRYGLRKTSMDDLARAAGLSRQGLYFHFPNKEALFREVVAHLAGVTLAGVRTALAADGPLEDRLHAALAGMYLGGAEGQDARNLEELLATANEIAGDLVREVDEQLLSAFAKAIQAECGRRPRAGELSPRSLAEHLYAASYGIKRQARSAKDYLDRMRVAVRLVGKAISP